MARHIGQFPFGQPIKILEQRDRTPKKAFVLGVYASAVHARWVGTDNKDVVKALAVASEPCIFWTGNGAEEIINEIDIPEELGSLRPAAPQFNGPSGNALDDLFLAPVGLNRQDAWLCDLVPHSCVNPAQQRAIDQKYQPLVAHYGLPMPSAPAVPMQLADERRRQAILDEIKQSQAETLILLGDQPIRWFLRFFDARWKRLSDFGAESATYGRRHHLKLDGVDIAVLPLAHPRQAAKLGQVSASWFDLHGNWVRSAKQ